MAEFEEVSLIAENGWKNNNFGNQYTNLIRDLWLPIFPCPNLLKSAAES